jgi:hypothetical protein
MITAFAGGVGVGLGFTGMEPPKRHDCEACWLSASQSRPLTGY